MSERLWVTRRGLLGLGGGLFASGLLGRHAGRAFAGQVRSAPSAASASAPAMGSGSSRAIKPIRGSWISIQHPNAKEAVLWDPACAAFTEQDWMQMVRDMAELGFEYVVLLSVAHDFKAYYKSAIFPRQQFACEDPIRAILRGADECGMKLFMGCGWFGNWADSASRTDRQVSHRRLRAMGELAERYGRHQSFFGWYWPSEAAIRERFSDEAVTYLNECSAEAGRLTPDKKTLIAPYGTRLVVPDDRYVRQLESMDVDIIAYQDEVGVKKTTPDELPRIYEGLRKAHDRVPQRALWADVEVFTFAGEVYKSALIPAPFTRVAQQLAAISPFVDTILIYQYQGLMNPPGSRIAVGHKDSVRLYSDYRRWKDDQTKANR
jgi:hypothetical protein